MRQFFVVLSISMVIAISSSPVYAERISQTDITVDVLGSHVGIPLYMSLVEGFDVPCAFGNIYCREGTKECPLYYSTALVAKLTNRKLKEIRYDYDPETNNCDLVLVSIQ
ncbi:hypothetical protein VU04_00855 [Desulfobulbus sp. TB]|nr:hypothetical protein [Desulfobulbus sp. TB]